MDYKKEAAGAAAELVQNNMVIGLGAGSAMGYMVGFLQEKVTAGLSLKILTSSFSTRLLLQKNNLEVHYVSSFASIDIYFDGCDQFDRNLNALKSGGGIHTNEKIIATMANKFIIVGDDSKYVEHLEVKYPLVVEVMPAILNFFSKAVHELFGDVKIEMRMSNNKDGAVISENGNYIFDLWFNTWPELANINASFKNIPGVIETSLFYGLAQSAVIAGSDGVRILHKPV